MATAKLRLHLYPERIEGECSHCGFDALIRARAYRITEHGVTTVYDKTHCGRCIAEKRRNDAPM